MSTAKSFKKCIVLMLNFNQTLYRKTIFYVLLVFQIANATLRLKLIFDCD